MNPINQNSIAAAMTRSAANYRPLEIPKEITEDAGKVINAVFRDLQSCHPAWRQAWPTDAALNAAKATWVKAFVEAGILNIEQVRRGISRCRSATTDFIPSVGKFISWCKPTPEEFGLPTLQDAYQQAAANAHPTAGRVAWSHPAVLYAFRKVSAYRFLNLTQDASLKEFTAAYADAVEMVMQGHEFPPIPLELPESIPVRGDSDKALGNAALAGLRSAFTRR